MAENLPEGHSVELLRRGIVPLHGIAEAFDAAEAAAFIGEAWSKPVPQRLAAPPSAGRPEGGGIGDEAAVKSLLRDAGLAVPKGARAASVEQAVETAERLGYPVAVKALGVAHKSELGAVRLSLPDASAVHEAATALLPLGAGLYVEAMVAGGVAELIVGITRDAVFGPVMTVGTGGVLVELLKDSATLLLPASRAEIETALRGLKMFPLLDGYRGRPKADLPAAIESIEGIAAFAFAHADGIVELDINPLIVCETGRGAWIVDALLVTDRKEKACRTS